MKSSDRFGVRTPDFSLLVAFSVLAAAAVSVLACAPSAEYEEPGKRFQVMPAKDNSLSESAQVAPGRDAGLFFGPGADSKLIAPLVVWDQLTVIGRVEMEGLDDTWLFVTTPSGKSGYVLKESLDMILHQTGIAYQIVDSDAVSTVEGDRLSLGAVLELSMIGERFATISGGKHVELSKLAGIDAPVVDIGGAMAFVPGDDIRAYENIFSRERSSKLTAGSYVAVLGSKQFGATSNVPIRDNQIPTLVRLDGQYFWVPMSSLIYSAIPDEGRIFGLRQYREDYGSESVDVDNTWHRMEAWTEDGKTKLAESGRSAGIATALYSREDIDSYVPMFIVSKIINFGGEVFESGEVGGGYSSADDLYALTGSEADLSLTRIYSHPDAVHFTWLDRQMGIYGRIETYSLDASALSMMEGREMIVSGSVSYAPTAYIPFAYEPGLYGAGEEDGHEGEGAMYEESGDNGYGGEPETDAEILDPAEGTITFQFKLFYDPDNLSLEVDEESVNVQIEGFGPETRPGTLTELNRWALQALGGSYFNADTGPSEAWSLEDIDYSQYK